MKTFQEKKNKALPVLRTFFKKTIDYREEGKDGTPW